MKLDSNLYGCVSGAAWMFALNAQAYGNEISITSVRNYFSSSLTGADPAVMVMVGVVLVSLRVLMARRAKRREKDPAHP